MSQTGHPTISPIETSRWPHRLAVTTSGATVVLILAGGLVTSLGAGLAVPDWPTTFGYNMFLFPWAKMVGGVFYEHSHRLLGSLVGILTILTAASLWWTEPRKWMRWLGVAALLLVIVQGLLGGLRVVWLKLALAIIHACTAQIFFGLMVSLAVLTSRNWTKPVQAESSEEKSLRRLSLATVSLIYIQTIFGAVLRHTGDRLDAHLLFAVLVTVHVIWLATKILRAGPELDDYRGTAHALWLLLVIQIGLGTGSFLTKYTVIGDAVTPWVIVILTASHVLVGALLFATSISLTIRLYRNRSWSWKFSSNELLPEQASAS